MADFSNFNDCLFCEKMFTKKCNMRKHINRVHRQYKISKNAKLRFSRVAKMFSPKRKFECSLCDLRFSKRNALQDHLKNHSEFEFECEICKFKYWKEEILEQHKKRTHEIKIEKFKAKIEKSKYVCLVCDAKFKFHHDLERHMMRHHTISPAPPVPKGLDIPKMFSNERQFPCSQCDLRFAYDSLRRKHENSHPRFQFKCQFVRCGKAYWKMDILKEHQKRAHCLKIGSANQKTDSKPLNSIVKYVGRRNRNEVQR